MSDLARLGLWGGHLLRKKGAGYLGPRGERWWVPLDEEREQGRPAGLGPRKVGAAKVRRAGV